MPAVDTGLAASPGRGKLFDGNWNGPADPSAPGDDFNRVMQAALTPNPKRQESTANVGLLARPHRITVPMRGYQPVEVHPDSRTAGVPPAGSPSVALGDKAVGETPPPPATGYARAIVPPPQRFPEPTDSAKSRPKVLPVVRAGSLPKNSALPMPAGAETEGKTAGEQRSPAGVERNDAPNLTAATLDTEGPEPVPAFLSLPLFLPDSWFETTKAAPVMEDAAAPAGASTSAHQPEPPGGALVGAMPTASSVMPQNPAGLEPAGEAELPAASSESDGPQNHVARTDLNPVTATETVTMAAGVTSEISQKPALIDPKEKAGLPATHPESGGTATLQQTSEPAVAQVSLPAEPLLSPRATDSGIGEPAAIETGVPQTQAGQSINVNSSALAPAAEIAGTGVASIVSSMNNPQKTNNVAGPDVKVLPVGEDAEAAEKNLPPPSPGMPAHVAESRSLDWSFAHVDNSQHTSAMEPARFFNVVDLPSLAEARLRALDQTHDMMAVHALRLVECKSDALSVVIKPAVGTELSLELRQRGGGVEAQATLLRGDPELLNQHWPELQQRLDLRGIKLAPLEGAEDFFANDHRPFQQPQTSQEDAAQQASAFAEFAAAGSGGGARARLAVVHDGWESWA